MFTHDQSEPAQTWVVQHGISGGIRFDCRVERGGDLVKILPVETDVSKPGTAKFTFLQPYCGTVQITERKTWSAGR